MQYFHSQEFVTNPPSNIYNGQSSLMEILKAGNMNNMVGKSRDEIAKSMAASKNHSEAERRRRKRINGHLSTLRTLLPNTIKTDKASLLAEVVRCLKELKETTSDNIAAITSSTDHSCNSAKHNNTNNNLYTSDNHLHYHDECIIVPSETDELDLYYCDLHYGTIKAVICCEDQPELMSILTRALKSVQGKVVRTEMATIGGRIKIVLWVLMPELVDRDEGLMALRRALVVVMGGATMRLPETGKGFSGGKSLCISHC